METVAGTNAALSNLMQLLTSVGSPLASSLSTPAMQSALRKASPGDIVKLSTAALELQRTSAMFGDSRPSAPGGTGLSSLFSELVPSSAATSRSTSTATQLAAVRGALQSEQTAALFGDTSRSTSSNGLVNLFG